MPAFLLDNNHVYPLYLKNSDVQKKLASFTNAPTIRICAITLGEIEAGHRMNAGTNPKVRDDFVAWLHEVVIPHAIPVTATTRGCYAEIVSRIWKTHPPTGTDAKTEQHLLRLGVDINDLWAVAVAFEHGMTFVTKDKMQVIRDVLQTSEVQFDCWI